MRKKSGKQILSLLLAVMIVFTGLAFDPTTVSAAAKAPTKITLSAKTATLNVGKTYTVKIKSVSPKKASKSVTYTTSKKSVATVSSKGVVKAVKAGKATITVTSKLNKKVKAKLTVTVKQPVKSITIKSATAAVQRGKTVTLKPTVSPSNASNKKVTYSSSNKKIATVNSKGAVKGIKAGTVTITIKAADGSKKSTKVKVTVYTAKMKKATVSPTKQTLYVGKSVTLKTKVTSPKSGVANVFTWKSSNSKIAKVDANGKVTAVKAGTATITGTAADGSKVKVSSKITVRQYVTAVKLTGANITIGSNVTIKASVSPSNASNKTLAWKSSDTAVATVDTKGVVTGLKAGIVTITATAKDGSKKSGSCKVTVSPIMVSAVSLNQTSANVTAGDVVRLTTTVSPANATNKAVTWATSNAAVATVNNGVVTTKTAGTVTITATAADGSGKTAKCTINVKAKAPAVIPVTGITLNQTTASVKANATFALEATVVPANATDKTVTWTTSNATVATVANGVVTPAATAENNETAVITAKAGNITATCTVTVITATNMLAESESLYTYTLDKNAVAYQTTYKDGRVKTISNDQLLNDLSTMISYWGTYSDTTKSLEDIWNSTDLDRAIEKAEENLNAVKLVEDYVDFEVVTEENGSKTVTATKADGSKEVKANLVFTANKDSLGKEISGNVVINQIGGSERTLTISDITRTYKEDKTTIVTANVQDKAIKVVINQDATSVNVYRVTSAGDMLAANYYDDANDEAGDIALTVTINKVYYAELIDMFGTNRDIHDVTLQNLYQ